MSEEAAGHGCADNQVEEEGHIFLSSKSDIVVNAKNNQSSFIDDELVTWLQYPLDDVTCPDIFQHWPPASPAIVTAFAPSPANLKDLSQHESEAFPVNAASGRSAQDVDGRTAARAADERANILLKQSSHQDATTADLRGEESGVQEVSPCFDRHGNEPTSTVSALRQAGPHVDERQDTSRDCRSRALPEPLLQEEPNIWVAREALGSQSKCTLAEKKIAKAETQNIANTQLKFLPQSHVEGSSSQYGAHREPAQGNAAADAALALGAGRATGAIRTSGLEAFSKVRTSSQSVLSSKLVSSPLVLTPLSPCGKGSDGSSSPTMLPPRARPVGFRSVTLSSQQSYPPKLQTMMAQPIPIRPCTNIPDIVSQERPLMSPLKGVSTSNENSSKESPLQSSMTASLGSQRLKQVEEGVNICSSSNRVAVLQRLDSAEMQKLSGTSSPRLEKRDDVALSGDSETSESLRETFSGSKRKMEDSECQSEDAEGESAVNSQTRTSSKRTRANEVHNLSERRRRNRINDKMNALRELIPNASKTNKAALLDEAIEYLKNLQLQLQVMSVRTGMSLSPMVVPPGLPHMQAPQVNPIYPVGTGTLGGSSTGVVSAAGSAMGVAMCNMTYGVPVRPPNPRMLQPPERSSLNQLHQPLPTPESVSLHYPHSFVQNPSQSMFSVNMDMGNTYLQQQHLQQHQQLQQQQQLQQHVHHHEQQASPQVQTPSPPSPAPQQSHYQL